MTEHPSKVRERPESVCEITPFSSLSFSSVSSSDLHHGQLSEYGLLLSEGRERSSSDDPDGHLQLQQPQQPAAAPSLLADQGLLRQGEEGNLSSPSSGLTPTLSP